MCDFVYRNTHTRTHMHALTIHMFTHRHTHSDKPMHDKMLSGYCGVTGPLYFNELCQLIANNDTLGNTQAFFYKMCRSFSLLADETLCYHRNPAAKCLDALILLKVSFLWIWSVFPCL